ncbi:MAG: sulfatase-like hydrolase/transferase [Pseudomonadales bacterium]
MTATARIGYSLKLFVSLLGTPWLIFLSTSIPLYLVNQAELHYKIDILYPFAILAIAIALTATLVFLLSSRFSSKRLLRYVFWMYLLAGILFLSASSLHGVQIALAYKVFFAGILLSVAVLAASLLDRKLSLEDGVNFFAAASLLFIALDLAQLYSRIETKTPLYSQRNEFAVEIDPSVSKLDRLPNIYHIVFDEFQTDMFVQTLDEKVKLKLAGFQFFPEATTLFGRTGMSLPSIFTGQAYDFATAQIDYQQRAFNSDRSFLYWLRRVGYEVSAYLHPVYDFEQKLFQYVTYHKDLKEFGAEQYGQIFNRLWVYSVFPSSVAKAIIDNEYIEQQENQNVLDPAAPVMSLKTMRLILEEEARLGGNGRYVFAHLILPHFPYLLEEDCSYSEDFAKTSALSQSRCATQLIAELVKTLKQLDRFSDSLIIIQSDHGARFALQGNRLRSVEGLGPYSLEWSKARSRSLLLIKPNGAGDKDDGFAVSSIPASLLDIAPTLVNALKLKTPMAMSGINLLGTEIAAVEGRTRYYHFFDKKSKYGWTDEISRYRIEGGELRNEGKIKLTNNPP